MRLWELNDARNDEPKEIRPVASRVAGMKRTPSQRQEDRIEIENPSGSSSHSTIAEEFADRLSRDVLHQYEIYTISQSNIE